MTQAAFVEYAAIPAVNWSTLKELRRSPLHYKHRLACPREDTSYLRHGRAVHTAVFEPERFADEYAVFDGPVRRGKAWEAFSEKHGARTILKADEYAKALAVRDAVHGNRLAQPYLYSGQAEKTIRWRDNETGLDCKGRVDFLSEKKPAIVDLKTSRSVDYFSFANAAYRMAYHGQLGFYRWGVECALSLQRLPVIVIAVEADAPHDVAVFEYGEAELDAGLSEARALLTKLAFHREADEWPGQYAEEQVLEFPSWVTHEMDNDITELGLEK